MQVTLLGTGTQVLTLRRMQTAILLEAAGERLLLDSGTGTTMRLLERGVAANQLDRILYTHFHPDHTIELVTLMFAHQHPTMQRETPLRIYGPPGMESFFERLQVAWPAVCSRVPNAFRVSELTDGPHAIGPFSVTAASTPHTDSSQGYRIEYGGVSFVYTGDTPYAPAVVALAQGADLLVTECSSPHEPVPGHLTSAEAGRIAAEAGVRQLVLTHLYPVCDVEDDLTLAARAAFEGPIRIAEDGQTIHL